MKRNSSPSSPRSAKPLRLQLRNSRIGRTILVAGHLAALLSLAWVPAPWPWLALLAGWLAWSAIHTVSSGPRWREIHCDIAGQWLLVDGGGSRQEVTVTAGGLVHPWLTVVEFRLADGAVRRLPLWPDSAPGAELKALRRRLAG